MTWTEAKAIMGDERVVLGPAASHQWRHAPEHLAMVLSRYRAAAALIGSSRTVLEVGCGEGIGADILAKDRQYVGIDNDAEAVAVAEAMHPDAGMAFFQRDILQHLFVPNGRDAVVSLDVIEHIPADREDDFMRAATSQLTTNGVCVIGTPNAAFDHLASPQSKADHVNTYTPARLHALMSGHFKVVQSFGMNDVSLHTGHPEARHYLMMTGIGPR